MFTGFASWHLRRKISSNFTGSLEFAEITLLQHGDDFETDVLLHSKFYPLEHQSDVGDLLDHQSNILLQLVHGYLPSHHACQTSLQRVHVVRHLVKYNQSGHKMPNKQMQYYNILLYHCFNYLAPFPLTLVKKQKISAHETFWILHKIQSTTPQMKD